VERDDVPLALGGGAISSISGGFRYTPAGPEETLEERALFVVVQDGDRSISIYIPRGNASDAVEGSFARGALSELPFTFQALQPTTGDLFNFDFSDAAAFATGS
jgi:hypothetical protein